MKKNLFGLFLMLFTASFFVEAKDYFRCYMRDFDGNTYTKCHQKQSKARQLTNIECINNAGHDGCIPLVQCVIIGMCTEK